VLRVSIDYLLALNVTEVILKDLFPEQINERLNVLCHLPDVLPRGQLREVDLRESRLEELDVEFVTEEDSNIINRLLHTQVAQDVIS
jgi:hypothetical protein